MYRLLVVLIVVAALSPQSFSQTFTKPLEGIKGVWVYVNFADDESARTCGVTEEGLRAAASFPVATSSLSLGDTGPAILSIGVVIVTLTNGGCAASYNVEVSVLQLVTLEATKLTKALQIPLWEKGDL